MLETKWIRLERNIPSSFTIRGSHLEFASAVAFMPVTAA